MALRNQPYIPLYVQDVLTDEKLIECSAQSHGVYFRLICLLHKQEEYGKLFLKQKHKQTRNKFKNFATMLTKQMPFTEEIIFNSLMELAEEKVISITDDALSQKRMIKDNNLSLIRATSGKMGGSNVTKQYGKAGYLYLMSNNENLCKIGISVNPQNRLYRLRSDNNLPKFNIVDVVKVPDMGKAEDEAKLFFKNFIDGEWITHEPDAVVQMFNLFKAKLEAKDQANHQANTENENEVEYETETDNNLSVSNYSCERKGCNNQAIKTKGIFRVCSDKCYEEIINEEVAEGNE